MMERDGPTQFQIEIARVFFGMRQAAGYLVAGGAALLASELIARPTEDLDLFAAAPVTSVEAARDAFLSRLAGSGYGVVVIHDVPTFCRLVVGRAGEEVLVDLAVDSPAVVAPTVTVLGPTVAPAELAGRKLLALFGRAEARDFADVYSLVGRFGKSVLLERAAELDAGFDRGVLAQMMATIVRFSDEEIPLPAAAVTDARNFFAAWSDELS